MSLEAITLEVNHNPFMYFCSTDLVRKSWGGEKLKELIERIRQVSCKTLSLS